MSDSKIATSLHPVVTCPPLLSNGEISPKSAKDFENHCLNYFVNAKGGIDNDVKVSCILGCFENDLINDWISVNCEQSWALLHDQIQGPLITIGLGTIPQGEDP